jgi:hypothetical protein
MLTTMAECGWPEDRREMFHEFWTNIQLHEYRDSGEPRDQRALMMLQDKGRKRWHMTAAAASSAHEIYDLAPICETKLAECWRKIDIQMRDSENRAWRETVRPFNTFLLLLSMFCRLF